jgi:hypothetical protein
VKIPAGTSEMYAENMSKVRGQRIASPAQGSAEDCEDSQRYGTA